MVKNKPQQPLDARIFQWAVIVAGSLVWCYYLAQLTATATRMILVAVALLGPAAILVSFKPVYITTPGMKLGHTRQLSISLSDALTFLLLLTYGPAPAIVVCALDGFIASRRTVRRWESNFFTLGMMALSMLVAAKTFELVMTIREITPYRGLDNPASELFLPLLIGTAAYFIANSVLCATIIALRYRRSLWQQLVDNHLWVGITYFPLAALAIGLYACAKHFGVVSALAAAPVLVVIYFSYQQYNHNVEEKLRHIEAINGLNLATVRALAMAIDAKSGATPGHAERIKIYSLGLARAFNLSELDTQALAAGAMLRDVGMLAVPDHILTKPGKLTAAEMEKMRVHPTVGAEILSQVDFPYPVAPVVRHHHERWDGTGYPDKLAGEDIPLTARILGVADSFDAAREVRNYRQALTMEQAVTWLRESAGTLFDPDIVEKFIAHLPEFEAEITAWVQSQHIATAPAALAGGDLGASDKPLPRKDYTQSLAQISGAHHEVVMLYQLAQSVGRSLSLDDTLNVLLEHICHIVPSTTSAVLLKEKSSDNLQVEHALGQHAEALQGLLVGAGRGLVSWVFANQEPAFNQDPQADLKALGFLSDVAYRTSLIVPITKGAETLGVLALYSADLDEYSSEHIRLAEAVAQMAGDAIANSLHYEATETTAYTDRLTGLPNLRAILRAFEAETAHAKNAGQPLTFLMMDLDGFKKINDTLGHHAGDLFLIEISRLIKSHLRGSDFFGRYAGDEFIALLPNTQPHHIGNLLERIRQAVDNCQVVTEDGRIARGGVSIGVSEYDGQVNTLEEIMAQADAAMYADKAERKRRKAEELRNEQVIPFPVRKSA